MRILFTGGGTGGHVFPIIAVARQIKKIYTSMSEPIGPDNETNLELYFLGAPGFTRDLENVGIKTKTILSARLRRYFSIQNFIDIFKLPIGIIQSLIYLYVWMPDVVFNKGGYGSVPVVIAAWIYRIPVLTHESDTIPGLANRLGAKFSKRIAISFKKAGQFFPQEKTALVGNPIREEITRICQLDTPENKQKAREALGLYTQKPVIFIMGGSQGAQALNQAVLSALPQLLEKYELIHQCGENNLEETRQKSSQILSNDYHLFPFLEKEQMGMAYLISDLVISRAGANSMAEIAACGRPSILVPLPNSGSGHQKENAFAYVQAAATIAIEQSNLTPNIFTNEINKIFSSEELRKKMATNARTLSKAEAAEKIALGLIELGRL